MKRLIFFIIFFIYLPQTSFSQEKQLNFTLESLLNAAHDHSLNAMVARHNLRAAYWEHRTYLAERLPSLNLSGNVGNYNRSLIPLQNAETGEINYIQNNNLQNSLRLSLDQNISFTGGTLSVYSFLTRIDQFSFGEKVLYNSQPINISYIQPLRAYNPYKWAKKISPEQYEYAKTVYLETMEDITIQATELFFEMLLAQQRYQQAVQNQTNLNQLLAIANQRFLLAGIDKSEILQLELRVLNSQLDINDYLLALERAMHNLRSFLGYNESVVLTLTVPENIPLIELNYDEVMYHAQHNSSFEREKLIAILQAQQSISAARAEKAVDVVLNVNFGLTQQGKTFSHAYRSPMDQEVVSLGISMPIFDWGQSRGRIKMAESRKEVIETQNQQSEIQLKQDIMLSVLQFNHQVNKCQLAQKADSIALTSYELTVEKFRNGNSTVIELNAAQSEKDQASIRNIQETATYWITYYYLRKLSLYDYLTRTDISEEFDMIIKN